jgi:hypothetical protein
MLIFTGLALTLDANTPVRMFMYLKPRLDFLSLNAKSCFDGQSVELHLCAGV